MVKDWLARWANNPSLVRDMVPYLLATLFLLELRGAILCDIGPTNAMVRTNDPYARAVERKPKQLRQKPKAAAAKANAQADKAAAGPGAKAQAEEKALRKADEAAALAKAKAHEESNRKAELEAASSKAEVPDERQILQARIEELKARKALRQAALEKETLQKDKAESQSRQSLEEEIETARKTAQAASLEHLKTAELARMREESEALEPTNEEALRSRACAL